MGGEMWGKMSPEEKAPFEERAAQDKAKYDAEQPPEPPKAKRNKSAYMFYTDKIRASLKEEFPDHSTIELTKVMGQRWKELSEEQKTEFNELAAKDKERFEEEKKLYGTPEPKKSKKS